MTPLTKTGLLLVAGSIGAGAILSMFASRTDMSLSGLAITFLAMPAFFVGVGCILFGVAGSLERAAPRMARIAAAVGVVAIAIVLWKLSGSSPGGARVSSLVLETDQVLYRGPCPAVVTVRARITVDRGSGLVLYEIRGYSPTRIDGTIDFNEPGTKTVTGTIVFGESGYARSAPGDLRARITRLGSPEAHADFRYECTN